MTPFTPNTEGTFYGLDASVYHAAPGVGQTTLKKFGDAASPLHFKNEKPKVPTPDMQFGTAIHAAILEPESFHHIVECQPETYTDEKGNAKPWHNGAAFCKLWNANMKGNIVLPKEDFDAIPKIVESAMQHDDFAKLMRSGKREVSHFRFDKSANLMTKCRVDLQAESEHGLWLADVKKVGAGGASEGEFAKSVLDYGYHIQAASYLYTTQAKQFVFMVVESEPPFESAMYILPTDVLCAGMAEYTRLLAAYAECRLADCWPGYLRGIKQLNFEPWIKRKMNIV